MSVSIYITINNNHNIYIINICIDISQNLAPCRYDNGDEQFEGEDDEPGWAPPPNPVHRQHMTSALMIQRAACLDLIGDKAFDEL